MKTLIATLACSAFTVVGWAQTNADIVSPTTPVSTNALIQTSPPTPPVPVVSAAVVSQDVRDVSGTKVNLGPIHDYERNPTGERPLKHWKKISFQTVGPLTAGQSTCKIKVEGGGEIIAVVKNVPASLAEAYTKAQRLLDEREQLAEKVKEDSRIALQNIQASQANAGGEPVNPSQALAADPKIQNAVGDLTRLEQSAVAAANYFTSISMEYAMFTGKKAGGLEVWDVGIKTK